MEDLNEYWRGYRAGLEEAERLAELHRSTPKTRMNEALWEEGRDWAVTRIAGALRDAAAKDPAQ